MLDLINRLYGNSPVHISTYIKHLSCRITQGISHFWKKIVPPKAQRVNSILETQSWELIPSWGNICVQVVLKLSLWSSIIPSTFREQWKLCFLILPLLAIQILEGCHRASPWVNITSLVNHFSPSMVATALTPIVLLLWIFSWKKKVKLLSRARLFVTPWTVAYQAPLSMGFSRKEHWSELPFPSPGDLPDSGTEPVSPTLQADALLSEPPGKSIFSYLAFKCSAWLNLGLHQPTS